MLVILLIFLLLLLFNIYYFNKFDLFSPSIVVVSVFFVSVFVVLLNNRIWNVSLHPWTVLIISSALILFFVGELIARLNSEIKNNRKAPEKLLLFDEIFISKYKLLSLIIIMSVTIFFQFLYISNNALLLGNYTNLGQLLSYSRSVINDSNLVINQSFLLTQGLIISKCIAYFFVFVIVYNKIFHNSFKSIFYNSIPITIYLMQAILTTGRTHFIYFFTVILILIIVLEKKKNKWSNKNDLKILLYILLSGLLFATIFSLLGSQRSSTTFDFSRSISLYVGSSIVAFDYFLINDSEPPLFFGEETLYSYNSLLRKIGVDIPFKNVYLEVFENEHIRTNIYTSLRRYIHDYTILGMFLIQLIIGYLYTKIILFIKYKKNISVSVIFLAMFFYPLVEYSIEERFIVSVITFSTIYHIIYIYLIFHYFTRKVPINIVATKKRRTYESY